MFSARTGWTRAPNRLSTVVEARRGSGAPLLDLTETNPTRAGLRAPADILAALADPAALAYDPEPLGRRDAREAIAADGRRRGAEIDPDRLVLTASTSEAYAFAFKLLCDPGDTVLVPRPSYPLFEYLAGLESVQVRPYPLRYDGTWHIDLAELAEALTDRTRAIVAVTPNNPTGSFVKGAEADALRALAASHGAALLSDEVFADFPLREDPGRALTLFADGPALTLCLGGLSKSCGLPQLKLAWMALAGPAAAREEARARLEVVADTYLSVSTPVQQAAPAVLARAAELQAPIRDRIRANLGILRDAAQGTPATLLDVEGGWSAVLHVPATRGEDEWVIALAEEDGVLVHPGYFFDFPREAYLVLSLLPPPPAFAEGVARILERVTKSA
ncbi:MAG TPA: pyridoxal phosphate-dependent aminotransferase [Vicinamibacteria bacterium]|nr:pyridoxal phosphate-dependent aminotransferase [Vicinamibacteria bacterium]